MRKTNSQLVPAGPVQITTVGIQFSGILPYQDWEDIGPDLGKGARGYSWSIGDWLVYGEFVYGDRYAQGMAKTGLSLGRLQNLAWLARKVPYHNRRENLSLSHHEAVAPLPHKHQATMLDLAELNNWDRDTLREKVGEVLAGTEPEDTDDDVIDPEEQRVIAPEDIIAAARDVAAAWRINSPRDQVGMTLHASLSNLVDLIGETDE